MKKIITIGRECGSGGHTIAMKVAKALDIPCYDKEIISLVAGKCMVSKEYAEKAGELLSGGLFQSHYGYVETHFPYSSPSLQDQINATQHSLLNKKHTTPEDYPLWEKYSTNICNTRHINTIQK